MSDVSRHDAWRAAAGYEAYMGRWSRRIAPRFVRWLDVPPALDWLEVGCGTGALTQAILDRGAPATLISIDRSPEFVGRTRGSVTDGRAEIRVGDALSLDLPDASRDVVVSGLVLNFITDRMRALAEMRRVARPGGWIGFYVWDYPGGGVGFMRAFWDAACELDPAAESLSESSRFPFCTSSALLELARDAGLTSVTWTAIEEQSVFGDFDDFWRPFTLGAGPAPGYCVSLEADARERLRRRLDGDLPREADGTIALSLRAWAIKAKEGGQPVAELN